MALHFDDARASIVKEVTASLSAFCIETVPLEDAAGRVLAEDCYADRNYPPFPRSARDGYAVVAGDVPGRLQVIGEVRAGERFQGAVGRGQAVEIMTGAPLPDGSDAVVMVEHTHREGDFVVVERATSSGDNFNRIGQEARTGEVVVQRGARLDYAHIAMLATIGCTPVPVVAKPMVAILATGDEIVAVDAEPLDHQIRNSNSLSLAAQVARAGGVPRVLPVAPDQYEATAALIRQGLETDLLLLSGGVSAGKYDIVETVLAGLGAEFYFDRVKVQPGQPLVFGRAKSASGEWKFFFGLPGNPVSTMVTFEALARVAVELLGGHRDATLPLPYARLTGPFHQKTGLTRFLPARLDGSLVTHEPWNGSGDVAALSRVNAFLVTDPGREDWAEGDLIRVLIR